MLLTTHKPCPGLSDIVLSYWSLELSPTAESSAERVYPTGGISVLFHYGTPFREVRPDGRSTEQKRSVLCGQSRTFSDVIAAPGAGVTAAVLYPHGLRALTRMPMSHLTGKEIRFGDLFPQERDLEDRLADAPDTAARVAILDSAFLKLRLSDPGSQFAETREALRLIEASAALISGRDLQKALNVSERKLQRMFLDTIGLSPHAFVQIRRINHAIRLLGSRARLTDIAQDAEFYDQPHFIRSFKTLTGLTPGEYRRILLSRR